MRVVEIDNLSFSYEGREVLKRVTFELSEGDYWALIGPNGGGKTTLLKLLLGFLKPTSGTLKLFGKSPLEARERVGYVPQIFQFDRAFPISVLEIVLQGRLSRLPWYGRFSQHDQAKALEALERVGLAGLASRPFGSLSGGQAQRAIFARALSGDPKLLLLDEPTASVDAHAEEEIWSLLKSLKKELTTLLVSHDLKRVVEEADRVVLLQGAARLLEPKELCGHFALGVWHP